MLTEISAAAAIVYGLLAWLAALFLGAYLGDHTAVIIAVIGIGVTYITQVLDGLAMVATGAGRPELASGVRPLILPSWAIAVGLWVSSVLLSIF
tara:strand:- start:734 stop:1015 length:282 start_codon:yes stop_codon:yes gene_type:complete